MRTRTPDRLTGPSVPDLSRDATRARIARVLDIHFDPDGGAPYWLQRQRELNIDVRREIREAADLIKLGPMEEQALARRPVEDFLPRSALSQRSKLIIGETAGTLGQPKYGVHGCEEFHAAFVQPFLVAAGRAGFPRGLNWLFVGPSGPHIIGKAANACAHAMGSCDCFTIDLDPRWAKKLPPGSFAWRRYVAHLEEQALTILRSQEIGVVFSTPVVLESLARRISRERREAIRGVHLGGLSVSPQRKAQLAESFPHAVIVSGYGNTLFGMMPELECSPRDGLCYFPHGRRLLLRVVVSGEAGSAAERLPHDVAYGERGQVVISRIDETQLIVNMMERDLAVRLPPPRGAAVNGFVSDGVADPQPIITARVKPALGLY